MQLSQKQIFNRIFKDLSGGFSIPKEEEAFIRQNKGNPLYGEITFASMDKLLKKFKFKDDDYFYDLGSGVGKFIIYASLNSNIKKAVGVELSKSRHEEASTAFNRALEYFPNLKGKCDFLNEDILNANIKKHAVIYTCSTAFSVKFMKEIIDKLSSIKNSFFLISLQELPKNNVFKLDEIMKLDMTWVRKTPVYIYKKL